VTLVYEEPVKNRATALRREAFLKRLTRAEKLALIDRVRG
jgi:putative endonuclease